MNIVEDIFNTIKEIPHLLFPHLYLNRGVFFLVWKWFRFEKDEYKWVLHWNFEILVTWAVELAVVVNVISWVGSDEGILKVALFMVFFSQLFYGLILMVLVGIAYKNKQIDSELSVKDDEE